MRASDMSYSGLERLNAGVTARAVAAEFSITHQRDSLRLTFLLSRRMTLQGVL
jgi:hypothetical protein